MKNEKIRVDWGMGGPPAELHNHRQPGWVHPPKSGPSVDELITQRKAEAILFGIGVLTAFGVSACVIFEAIRYAQLNSVR